MRGALDRLPATEAAMVDGDLLSDVNEPNLCVAGEERQRLAYEIVRHRVVVVVESNEGGFVYDNAPLLVGRRERFDEPKQARTLLVALE